MQEAYEEHLSHLYPQAHIHNHTHTQSLSPSLTSSHTQISSAAGASAGRVPGLVVNLQGDTRYDLKPGASCLLKLCELKQPQAQEVSCPSVATITFHTGQTMTYNNTWSKSKNTENGIFMFQVEHEGKKTNSKKTIGWLFAKSEIISIN